jgi:hypothetical protein
MGDKITVTVYDPNGIAIGQKVESIQTYALRMFENKTTKEARTAFVDMLNYGAAAQTYFNYDADNLVNNVLEEKHKNYASGTPEVKDNFENIENLKDKFAGSNLIVKSHIIFQLAFKTRDPGLYAKVEYTNYLGNSITKNINLKGNVLTIEGLSLADARTELTITVYKNNGTEFVTMNESMESYCSRMMENSPIFASFMTFADSAKVYLLTNNNSK